jgi:hypothetical protein
MVGRADASAGVDAEVEAFLTTLVSGTTWNQMPGLAPFGSMTLSAPVPGSR